MSKAFNEEPPCWPCWWPSRCSSRPRWRRCQHPPGRRAHHSRRPMRSSTACRATANSTCLAAGTGARPAAPRTSTTRSTDKWTKKTSMPRLTHHAALAAANGKIYMMGGFVPPKDTAIPVGGAWEPIDNAWEYSPAADSWKSLPPLPGKRGAAIAAEAGGKIYVIGSTPRSKDRKIRTPASSDRLGFSAPTRCTTPRRTVGEPRADVGAT